MLGKTACVATCLALLVQTASSAGQDMGPRLEDADVTTCEEFSRYARFNPNSVVDDIWVVFYYYSFAVDHRTYQFFIPSAKSKKLLQKYLNESVTASPVNWSRPLFVMKEMSSGAASLLVQLADRGQCLAYPVIKKVKPGRVIHPEIFIFKQSEGGKYLTLMMCYEHIAYVMARPFDIPRKEKIPEEVAKTGFRGRGRSYLYRGHHWMPIPEADERAYPPERFYRHGKIPPASFARLRQ